MGNSPLTSGYCSQNHNIPLVCPLDIQGSCDSSVFGNVIRSSDSNTNVGLVNFSWSWRLEGLSLLLGMLLGSVITIIIAVLVKHCRKKRRDGGWKTFPHFNWWQSSQAPLAQPMTPRLPANAAPSKPGGNFSSTSDTISLPCCTACTSSPPLTPSYQVLIFTAA